MMKALIALWLLVIAFAAPAMAGDRMLSAKSTPVINAITGQRLTLGQRIGAVAMLGLDVIDPFIVAKGASKAFTASGQVLQSFTRGLADNLAPGRIRNVIQQTAGDAATPGLTHVAPTARLPSGVITRIGLEGLQQAFHVVDGAALDAVAKARTHRVVK